MQAFIYMIVRKISPTNPLAITTTMRFQFHFHRPINAITLTATANQSSMPSVGKRTCKPNQIAKFNTTPTTAAVMADSAAVRFFLPRSCSMCGAPRRIHRKHGKNVVHVVINAPSVAASKGGRLP